MIESDATPAMTPATTAPTAGQHPLPDGWRWVRLGDVCVRNTGTCDPRTTPNESFIYVDIGSIDGVSKRIARLNRLLGQDAPSRARQIIRTNDVIVSTTRPNLNAVALVQRELDQQICSTGFCVLRCGENISPDYLFYFVQYGDFVQGLSELVKGALYPAVTDSQVRDQFIPLPPLPEQRRIAAALRERLAAVERMRAAADAQLAAARALPAAALRAVFESDEARAWPRVRLGDVCERITDGTHQPPPFTKEGVPFLFVRNIVGGFIDFDVDKHVSEATYEELTKRCRPTRNDVLYSAVGSFGVAVAVDTDRAFTFQRHIAHIKPNLERVDPHYLAYFINSPDGRTQSDTAALGGAQRTVTLASLANFDIPLPSLSEQRSIAAELRERMAEAERVSTTLQAQLEAIAALPQALMRQAFAGEL